MTPERFLRIQQVLNQRQPDLSVITDEVHKGRNLSAIIRSCDAVGVDTLHCVVPQKGFRHYRGTALGSHKWVDVQFHACVEEAIQVLLRRGFQIVAAHLSPQAIHYRELDYTRPTALLLGTEKAGVSHPALNLVQHHVQIPMMGMVESYNVSVACAAVLLEAQYQRQLAGFYDQCRLDGALYRKRFFQWAHPQVAVYCDKQGLEYPEVGDDGEIIAPAEWYQSAQRLCAKSV